MRLKLHSAAYTVLLAGLEALVPSSQHTPYISRTPVSRPICSGVRPSNTLF